MQNLKKLKNFLRIPLTTREITALIKAHILQVCGHGCSSINPDELELREMFTLTQHEMVVVYYYDDLYWEVRLNREVAAYSKDVAKYRYEGTRFAFSELVCSGNYSWCCYFDRGGNMAVKVWGTSADKLRLKLMRSVTVYYKHF